MNHAVGRCSNWQVVTKVGTDLGEGLRGPGPPGSIYFLFFYLVIIYVIFIVGPHSKTLGLSSPQ